MAIVQADWSIDRATSNIRYIGDDHGGASPSYATVIEFHRWLQDLADEAVSSGDDELDITDTDPSARSTDNIILLKGNYNIDDNASEHLYNGSIKQGAAGTEKIYAGFVNFGNVDKIQIIQNGVVLTDDWWNLAAGGGVNSDTGISHQFLLTVRSAGLNIDNRKIIGITRQFGFTYSEFTVNFATEGNNVLALSEVVDLNNQTAIGTVAGYTGITNTVQGYNGIDVNNDTVNEFYYSKWDSNKPTNSINDFYERAKWLTREGTAETLYGLSGELFRGITHEITVNGPTGTFAAFEAVSWTGGTGQMLAINSPTAATKMWIQLLTGVAPTNTQTITGASTATANAVGTAVTRTVSYPFVGASTGSAIIGAYGIGIETNDLTNSDTLFDLTNTSVNPPNNVTFTVGGIVSGEDRVLVAPWDGVSTDVNGDPAIDQSQLSLAGGGLTTDNITSVVVSTAIPGDTPASGTIRVVDDLGFDRRLEYSSYSGSTFTISSTDGQEDFAAVNATAGNDVYITYLDLTAAAISASFTAIYSSNRDLVVVVRDGGVSPIKQFISSATFSGSNTTVTAIRTSDV
tara:strand:- start:4120 stop:5838 length:1719 start_codon:yes stop_codon:yes gene_type:complete